MEISVSDNGDKILTDSAVVTIYITNINERPIILSKQVCEAGIAYCFDVFENVKSGEKVGSTLFAKDQDRGDFKLEDSRSDFAGDSLVWSIIGGNWGNRFTIDGPSGQLS